MKPCQSTARLQSSFVGQTLLTKVSTKRQRSVKFRESQFAFGVPYRILEINGLSLPIYKSDKFLQLLGRKKSSLRKLEKKGIVPEPIFRAGARKYYSVYELHSVVEAHKKLGFLRLYSSGCPSTQKFSEFLFERFRHIEDHISKGIEPTIRIYLSFESYKSLEITLKSLLNKYHQFSHLEIKAIANELCTFSG